MGSQIPLIFAFNFIYGWHTLEDSIGMFLKGKELKVYKKNQ